MNSSAQSPGSRRVDPSVMRSLNAIELLDLVRQQGPVSRADLARISQLSKPTVSDQIDALVARGLVVGIGQGEGSARGGKKPNLLKYNAAYGRVLGVDVGPDLIRVASADLMGNTLDAISLPTRPESGAHEVLRTIRRGLSKLIEKEHATWNVQLISAAVPGIVDVKQGIVLETDNVFGWRNLEFARELGETFGIPVHVDNDTNMAALAELNAAGGSAPDNFVLLRLNTGIGAGVVLNRAVHHGSHWAAGEISHMILNTEAAFGTVNPRGYLESVVGSDCVTANAKRLGKKAADRDLIAHLACAVSNLAAVFDPEAVILLGGPFPDLLEPVKEIVSNLLPWTLDIRMSRLGEDASLQGALAAGAERARHAVAASLRSDY